MSKLELKFQDRSGIKHLEGKILTEVSVDKDKNKIRFTTSEGEKYVMYHDQDCCEDVYVDDICGDIDSLIGETIVSAEEVSNEGPDDYGTYTWTFYHIRTVQSSVTIRWYGSSNGYYSESVSFKKYNQN